jgi:hypothetical protein
MMMKRKDIVSIALLCIVTVFLGCDEETKEEKSCKSTMKVLCEKACECADPEKDCLYFYDRSSSLSERGHCVETEVFFNCGNASIDPIDMDFDKCRIALEDASCGESHGGWAGLPLPEECSALLGDD